jgi:RNA polymerase sigma-70 factor (ECF subfamily)
VAGILGSSEESVTSALKRARATLQQRMPPGQAEPPPPPGSASEHELVRRLAQAFEAGDVDNVVALLTDDAWLAMPPSPLEYQGRHLAARFFAAVSFRDDRIYRMVATRANGQPALAAYVMEPSAPTASANGLLVLTLARNRICAVTRFGVTALSRCGLPPTLPG